MPVPSFWKKGPSCGEEEGIALCCVSKGASELPRCCCLLQIPVPPVLLWCPQFTLSPSLHTTAELVFWDLPRAGVPDFWCPVRDILAQKGAALPLFSIVDPQIQKPASKFYCPLQVRVGLCSCQTMCRCERDHPHSKLCPLQV